MSPDLHAMMARIVEADRAIELATHEIHVLRARINDLEIENARLRARLVKAQAVIEHYESPGDL